jgi:two-component system response regulator NreC
MSEISRGPAVRDLAAAARKARARKRKTIGQKREGNQMRVLIVDDHAVMRSGMRTLLEKTEDVKVVGEACTAPEAVKLAESSRPDMVFMDIELPGGSGIGATEEIVRNHWCENVVMVTAHDSRSCVESALRAGARGYVLKTGAIDEILDAMEQVCGGGTYVTPLLQEVTQTPGNPLKVDPLVGARVTERLSARELEVLVGIVDGLGSKEIALELGVSHRTVETHRTNMMRKLGARKVSEVVRLAIREGLVVA